MLRIVKTENGLVKGFPGTNARIAVFKGIPFAAPPVGENRFRAPQPAESWVGVRECYEYGPIAMQGIPGKDPEAFYSKEWHVDPEIPMSEDCLYLNVWTPAKTGDEKLPVMMWIHGGGMQEGYGHEQEFDGEHFAKRGIVLVSITYRLNVFAFMAHPEITAESPEAPTNFGLLDMEAAVDWIRRNIAAFGGDPENITCFGQSGGGDAVQHLSCSPVMKGKFQRAIIQSAGLNAMFYPALPFLDATAQDLSAGEERGIEFFDYLGIKTLEEARALSAQYITDKQLRWRAETGRYMHPWIDRKFCFATPAETMVKNEINDLSIMVTATGDEFFAGARAPLADWAQKMFGDRAEEYLDIVKKMAGSDDPEVLVKTADFSSFCVANRLTAEILAKNGREVYFSVFDPEIPGDDAGAFHSCDLWFEFETLASCWRPFDGHHYDLSRKMCNYFANFARTGDPNGPDADGTPMPEWKTYNEIAHPIMLCDTIYYETETDPRHRMIMDENLKRWGLQ